DADQYELQYLRYYLEVVGKFQPHDAKDDVLLLACVFEKLADEVAQAYNVKASEIYRKMVTLSMTPVKLKKITFGKHFGKTFEQIAQEDRGYLKWLWNERKKARQASPLQKPKPLTQDEEDLEYTLRCYVS
ncbi:MAG: hypothetical protein ACPGTI_08885, partial [bacterium]